jgi:hypothetical protein
MGPLKTEREIITKYATQKIGSYDVGIQFLHAVEKSKGKYGIKRYLRSKIPNEENLGELVW